MAHVHRHLRMPPLGSAIGYRRNFPELVGEAMDALPPQLEHRTRRGRGSPGSLAVKSRLKLTVSRDVTQKCHPRFP